MPSRAVAFRKTDVVRALVAARAGGVAVERFEVDPETGAIKVYGKAGTPPPGRRRKAKPAAHAAE